MHTHTHTHLDTNLARVGEFLDSKFIKTLSLNTIYYEIHGAIGTVSRGYIALIWYNK